MIDWQTFSVAIVVMWVGLTLSVMLDGSLRWRDKITVIAVCGVLTLLIVNA